LVLIELQAVVKIMLLWGSTGLFCLSKAQEKYFWPV